MATFADHWWLFVVVLGGAGVAALWFVLVRTSSSGRRSALGYVMFGPFWQSVNNYFARRGGFTRREWIGWAIVALIMVGAFMFTKFTGSGRI